MAEELSRTDITPQSTFLTHDPPRFRIHRVTCPRCGASRWFTLFSERMPEEVEKARTFHERRLLEEPCERHRCGVEGRPAHAAA